MYYRGASAAVVVFDVTNRDSFEGAKSWVKELQRRGDPNVVIGLAGNKADIKDKRVVEAEEARDYAKEQNLIYMDTSAKTNLNVKELFVAIGKSFFNKKKRSGMNLSKIIQTLLIILFCFLFFIFIVFSIARKLPRTQRERDTDVITNLKEEPKATPSSGGCCK